MAAPEAAIQSINLARDRTENRRPLFLITRLTVFGQADAKNKEIELFQH